jgi:hypothetical protein
MRKVLPIFTVVMLSIVAGCSSDSKPPAALGLASKALRSVPADLLQGDLYIDTLDLVQAGNLANLAAPAEINDKTYAQWLLDMDSAPAVSIMTSSTLLFRPPASALQKELGFTAANVATITTLTQFPGELVIVTGVDAKGIDAAIGPRSNDVWEIGSDEGGPAERTAVRRVGEPIRIGQRDDLTLITQDGDDVRSWIANSGQTLADNPDLAAVAKELDQHKVYAATIIRQTFREPTKEMAPYSVLGLGLTVEKDQPVGVLVYHHADAPNAAANKTFIEKGFASGLSPASNQPYAQNLEIRTAEVVGSDLVIIFDLKSKRVLLDLLLRGDPLLVGGLDG